GLPVHRHGPGRQPESHAVGRPPSAAALPHLAPAEATERPRAGFLPRRFAEERGPDRLLPAAADPGRNRSPKGRGGRTGRPGTAPARGGSWAPGATAFGAAFAGVPPAPVALSESARRSGRGAEGGDDRRGCPCPRRAGPFPRGRRILPPRQFH